jgi:hypothetical protein
MRYETVYWHDLQFFARVGLAFSMVAALGYIRLTWRQPMQKGDFDWGELATAIGCLGMGVCLLLVITAARELCCQQIPNRVTSRPEKKRDPCEECEGCEGVTVVRNSPDALSEEEEWSLLEHI